MIGKQNQSAVQRRGHYAVVAMTPPLLLLLPIFVLLMQSFFTTALQTIKFTTIGSGRKYRKSFLYYPNWPVHDFLSEQSRNLQGPPTMDNEIFSSSFLSSRRNILIQGTKAVIIKATTPGAVAAATITACPLTTLAVSTDAEKEAATSILYAYLSQLKQADSQLDKVPTLIQQEKWDAVRAILITSPLSDCWAKTNRQLIQNYANVLGDLGGDELAALEQKEDLQGHLRFLDMAVYNNNFNPITVEGTTNASPTLISSYFDDPIREYQASRKALQTLIQLSQELLFV